MVEWKLEEWKAAYREIERESESNRKFYEKLSRATMDLMLDMARWWINTLRAALEAAEYGKGKRLPFRMGLSRGEGLGDAYLARYATEQSARDSVMRWFKQLRDTRVPYELVLRHGGRPIGRWRRRDGVVTEFPV